MTTVSSLLNAAKVTAERRPTLLLLLSLLAGVLTAIFYRPAVDVVDGILAALDAAEPGEEEFTAAANVLTNGLFALVFGQLSLIAISAYLLPYWSRACSPAGLVPGEGGISTMISRGTVAFKYLLMATGLTLVAFVIIAPIAAGLSQIFGGLGSLVIMIGAMMLLWLNFAWSAVAGLAIAYGTNTTPSSFKAVWDGAQPLLRPVTGAYAAFWLGAGILNLLLGNLITTSLAPAVAKPLALVLSGALSYAAVALHLGALFSIKGVAGKTDS